MFIYLDIYIKRALNIAFFILLFFHSSVPLYISLFMCAKIGIIIYMCN